MSALELVAELEKDGVRLWEESGNLRFLAPKGVMTEDRRAALRRDREGVLELLRRRTGFAALTSEPDARYEPFPLTDVQAAYLLGRRDAFPYGGVACHGYGELAFPDVDPLRLEAAWQTLVRRHDMLRAVIDPRGSQRIIPTVPDYRIRVVDLRGADGGWVINEIEGLRADMGHRVYRPDVWPLFDLVVTLQDNVASLHFSIDFLISDFVSTQLLLDELHQLYFEPTRPLPPLDITFRDYLLAERRLRDGRQYERDREYWLHLLDQFPGAPDLPVFEGHTDTIVRFRRWQFSLAPEEWAALRSRASSYGITASVAVLAAYAETIGRWSRQPQFTLDLTLQNRLLVHPQVGRLVGDFTSVELLAVEQHPAASLSEYARGLQVRLWEDLDHRLFSGIEVLREVARRHGQDAALFPVVFTSSIGVDAGMDGGLRGLSNLAYGITQTPQVWIDCQVMERRSRLAVNWDVRDGVFPETLVDEMFHAYERLLRRMASEDGIWDSFDPVELSAGQRERRRQANNTSALLPSTLLHEGVVAQALRTPDRLAVVGGGRLLTYGELLGRAIAVADALRAGGCSANDVVGVMLDKGCDQPVAVLGALLAGAAYVPIDTDQPPARRNRILKDASARLVVVHSASEAARETPSAIRCIAVDALSPAALPTALPAPSAAADDVAYVIYTSGSTGVPKGVMISHRGAVNTIEDINRRFEVGPADSILGLANLGFDLSVYDIFGLLSVGGSLVLPDRDRLADPSHWANLVAEHHVTLWNSVPAQMQMLYDYLATADRDRTPLSSLRLALLSGDWIPVRLPDQIRAMVPDLSLISLGGATEASIWSIFHPIGDVMPHWHSIPYGRPLTNQSFHILDASLRPCPDLVPGELYIGGIGLAIGYLGDEVKTVERFIRHPVTGDRLYRTGDLGRYLADGSIEFLGREDRQVKIRGHRIELAEIEEALRSHPAVAGATVLIDGETSQERRAVAFVEPVRRIQLDEPSHDTNLRLAQVSAAAGAEAMAVVDLARYAKYARRLDEAALLSMLYALRAMGLLGESGDTLDGIMTTIPPRHRRVVRRWVRALETSGLAKQDAVTGRYREARIVATSQLDEAWRQVEDFGIGVEEPRLIEYFRTSARRLPDLLRGDEEPLQLLFPSGRVDVAEAIYRDALVARWATYVVTAVLREIASQKRKTLRVIEVGAGTGGTTIDVLKALREYDVDYLFTDLSPFFLNEARKRFCDHPFVRFAVFDLNEEYYLQGLKANSFEIVLATDVLHSTRNVDLVLSRLKELLAPGGWLVFTEMTGDHYAIMASLELLLGLDQDLGDFTDERAGRDQTFLSERQWLDALARTGAETVLHYPDGDDVTPDSRMRVFAARVKRDRVPIHPTDLVEYLATYLPEYMLPSDILVVDAIPLTTNAKIDHKMLRSRISKRPLASVATGGDEPASGLERQIADMWTEVLGVEHIGRHQGFLEMGGDSLLASRLAGRLRESVPQARALFFDDLLRRVLEGPTVAELAAVLAANGSELPQLAAPVPTAQVRQLGGSGKGSVRVLVHDGSGTLTSYDAFARDLADRVSLVGLGVDNGDDYLRIDPNTLVERIADVYVRALMDENYRSVHLVAERVGCVIAVEVARRLTEAGAFAHSVTLIGGWPLPNHAHMTVAVTGTNVEVYRHSLLALSRYEGLPYAGDITIVWHPGDPVSREEVVAFWREMCLGDVRVVDILTDDVPGLVETLINDSR